MKRQLEKQRMKERMTMNEILGIPSQYLNRKFNVIINFNKNQSIRSMYVSLFPPRTPPLMAADAVTPAYENGSEDLIGAAAWLLLCAWGLIR